MQHIIGWINSKHVWATTHPSLREKILHLQIRRFLHHHTKEHNKIDMSENWLWTTIQEPTKMPFTFNTKVIYTNTFLISPLVLFWYHFVFLSVSFMHLINHHCNNNKSYTLTHFPRWFFSEIGNQEVKEEDVEKRAIWIDCLNCCKSSSKQKNHEKSTYFEAQYFYIVHQITTSPSSSSAL